MHRSTLIGSAVARRMPRAVAKSKQPDSDGESDRDHGLYLICAVELFERLGGAMAFCLLVLYLNEYVGMGAGWATRTTSYVHMLSYAAGILGGLLGDKRMGTGRAALAGLVLLTLGYCMLGYAHQSAVRLVTAACLVVAGSGFYKPNCTALLGALYPCKHPNRTRAFYWFYYAINLSSMIAPCLGGLVRAALGWEAMFRLAAGFVVIAWGVLALGRQYLGRAALTYRAPAAPVPEPSSSLDNTPHTASRTGALVFVLLVFVLFGAVLSQGYGILLLWARDEARRSLFGYQIPPDFFAALPAAFVLVCGPLLGRLTKALEVRGVHLDGSLRFTLGMLLCALAYSLMLVASLLTHDTELASPLWLVGCKILLALGELLGVPVALALAESLALSRTRGLTMGLSYGSHALGSWLGGEVSALWPRCSHAAFFALLTGGCVVAAVMIHAQAWRLTRALSGNVDPRRR